ncbi:hypothetical protein GCM10017044_11310 [Kordiimonas sediminis]|uniref:Sulphotransferase Stf0 domain-containing protein n=1 Tax=Kordiimonas sediminis TaxID=1735581 RepID=A0A919ANG3_9PROT|nr:Stf0 family sulfotransferase [Kordiimonas sediminis]GHF18523.1 hypothetical protein GCM10017044_11310 [Kordiimonas sediminis]
MKAPRQIILCATQRCGSTIVVEDLRNTELLGMPQEAFIPWSPSREGVDFSERLQRIQERDATDNGVFSVKVMARQLPVIEKCLALSPMPVRDDVPDISDKVFPYVSSAFKDATFVWIRRRDTIRQAISRVMARQTGVNHAVGDKNDEHFAGKVLKGYSQKYNQNADYRQNAIRGAMKQIQKEELVWQRFFRDWDIKPIMVDYEQYVDTWEEKVREIAAAVDVTLPTELKQRKLVKLSNAVNDEWFRRYTDDVIAELSENI